MEEIDDKLWFEYDGCVGKHFILGNPHTFPGRMMGWCPTKNRSFFFSKCDITNSSSETEYWVKGFLSGNQPKYPRINEDIDFESEEYKVWQEKIKEFESSGLWKYDNEEED